MHYFTKESQEERKKRILSRSIKTIVEEEQEKLHSYVDGVVGHSDLKMYLQEIIKSKKFYSLRKRHNLSGGSLGLPKNCCFYRCRLSSRSVK